MTADVCEHYLNTLNELTNWQHNHISNILNFEGQQTFVNTI